ncbi:MAG: tRNA (guanosine(37)-N1)-methyltransferase TrmD [Butyricicoccaceae bacterium]
MRIDILTLFPEMVDSALRESIIGRGRDAGLLDIRCHHIRDYSPDKRRRTDDYPYGGGQGMVMQCEPLARCLEDVKAGQAVHTVLMSPAGAPFDQAKARELLAKEHIILVCGHYEGVDQRFVEACVDEELSIGDFVLTGGELAAMVVTDAVCRMVPGVLAETASFEDESHWSGVLEYPQYTRPEVWRGRPVPQVLLSGNHENIGTWRRLQALYLTRERRPDLFANLTLDKKEKKLLSLLDEALADESLQKNL